MSAKVNVLFVCLGNICRSPLAEAIFNAKLVEQGLESLVAADSCGTGAYHIGENPDPRSIATAVENDVPIQHKARQLTAQDGERFDYIIAMDDQNVQNMNSILKGANSTIHKMREFDAEAPGADVPDPYFGGPEGFQDVFEMLERSTSGLIEYITVEKNLNV